MQVHASSGTALRAVHATPPAWRCCLTVQKSHMPVSVRARARSHTSQILRPDRGRGAPLASIFRVDWLMWLKLVLADGEA